MARLKPCRDCGHMVSPRADICPWCRANKPTQRFLQRHPLIGLLVLGILLCGAINVLAITAETGAKVLSILIA
jgi:hypothetical protein